MAPPQAGKPNFTLPKITVLALPARQLSPGLKICQPRRRVAEGIKAHAHPVHQRQVQAARSPVVVAGTKVSVDTSRLDAALALAREDDRQTFSTMSVTIEQAR